MKVYYITEDGVNIYKNDSFYYLYEYFNHNVKSYDIKFWDNKVMASFKDNEIYLKDKIKFSDKDAIKNYIKLNNIEVTNPFILNH